MSCEHGIPEKYCSCPSMGIYQGNNVDAEMVEVDTTVTLRGEWKVVSRKRYGEDVHYTLRHEDGHLIETTRHGFDCLTPAPSIRAPCGVCGQQLCPGNCAPNICVPGSCGCICHVVNVIHAQGHQCANCGCKH